MDLAAAPRFERRPACGARGMRLYGSHAIEPSPMSSERPAPLPLVLRIARALATLAGGAVLAAVIAFWGWRWLAPAPAVAPVPREPSSWAPAIVAAPLFGDASVPAARAPAQAVPLTLQGETRLLGVFAERDGGGYALFKLASRGALLVKSGDMLADGVKLVAVHPDGVRLDDHGELRDVALRPASPAIAAPSSAAAATSASTRGACVLPAGYRGPVYRLNAELLTGLSAQPASWQSLVTPADGALVVRAGSALAPALGLSPGDRITQANGIALARIDDAVAAIVRPLLASQPVRVVGTHDGKPAEWVLVNAGACPA
jgi:hypothetical protein